jgi:hypothetical protein
MTPAWNHEPTVTTVAEGRGTAWNHEHTITSVAEGRGTAWNHEHTITSVAEGRGTYLIPSVLPGVGRADGGTAWEFSRYPLM